MKIDIEKLLCSLIKRNRYKNFSVEIIESLKDQGFLFDGNNIVSTNENTEVSNVSGQKPKFKVDDWVVYDHKVYQVVELPKEGYINLGLRGNGKIEFAPSTYCRHWTIQDAKPGDVLTTGTWTFIFKKCQDKSVYYHCAVSIFNNFSISDTGIFDSNHVHPATKEQCDALMKAMINVGYTFDFDKKELKKIEQKEGVYNKLTDYNLTDFEVSLKHIMEEAIECGDTHNLKADAELLISIAHKQFIKKSAEWLKNNAATYFGGGSPYEEDLISDYIRYIK